MHSTNFSPIYTESVPQFAFHLPEFGEYRNSKNSLEYFTASQFVL